MGANDDPPIPIGMDPDDEVAQLREQVQHLRTKLDNLEVGWVTVRRDQHDRKRVWPEVGLSGISPKQMAEVLRFAADRLDGGVSSLQKKLAHHLAPGTDPCQDRGVDFPCDVAEALGV